MRAYSDHIGLTVGNVEFYRKLANFLGFRIVKESDHSVGFHCGNTEIWVRKVDDEHAANGYDRENIGLNHLAFGVDSVAGVDRFYREFMQPNSLSDLYGGPKEYPQYEPGY